MSRQRKVLCSTILLLYGISFLLPVTGRPQHNTIVDFYSGLGSSAGWNVIGVLYGYEVFGQLAIGVICPSPTWVWFANPALWIGVILLATGKWRIAWIAGCFALLLGIWAGGYIIYHGRDMHLYIGYYIWLGSIGLLALSRNVLGFAMPQGTVP